MTGAPDRLSAALPGHRAIQRELGRGGMAVVFLAQDRKLGRPVALKRDFGIARAVTEAGGEPLSETDVAMDAPIRLGSLRVEPRPAHLRWKDEEPRGSLSLGSSGVANTAETRPVPSA